MFRGRAHAIPASGGGRTDAACAPRSCRALSRRWRRRSSLSGSTTEPRNIAFENFWSKNASEWARTENGGGAEVLPCILMKTADNCILMGWLASQTDMLAEDWLIVE